MDPTVISWALLVVVKLGPRFIGKVVPLVSALLPRGRRGCWLRHLKSIADNDYWLFALLRRALTVGIILAILILESLSHLPPSNTG